MPRSLQPLLAPESIAVVGASPRGNRGLQILQNLRRFDTQARVYPVHPRESVVDGRAAYPDLGSLPEVCDFVAIAVDADRSLDVLEDAIALGSRAGLIIASGFGEGGAGLKRKRRLDELLEGTNFLLCGPNCYGVLNAAAGFAGYSGQVVEPFTSGRVAVVMQSGALTHSLTDSSVGRGLGLSHLITTGNEASVTLGEYVAALAQDDNVDTIGVFIEGLRDAEVFAEAASEARRRGKAIVALTTGRSELGQRAAMAHTGAVAGSAGAMAGYLLRHGVAQASDLDEFREMLLAFSTPQTPTADGVALVSISGGGTGLLSDLAAGVELDLPALAESTTIELRNVLPDFATAANPLDATGAAVEDPSLMVKAITTLQDDPGVGAVVLALNVPGGSSGQEDLYRTQAALLAAQRDHRTPVVAITLTTGPVDAEVLGPLSAAGIPFLVGARPALAAVKAWAAWHHQDVANPRGPRAMMDPVDLGDRDTVIGRHALDVVAKAGVPIPAYAMAADTADATTKLAGLTAPVVLKVESSDIPHKTEAGGVALNIRNSDELVSAAKRMLRSVRASAPSALIEGLLLQEQVTEHAVECLVGVVRDPQVGLVISVTPGGVLAELSGPARTMPVPLSRPEAEQLIDSSSLAILLHGYRGKPEADRHALVEIVLAFADVAARCGTTLAAAELNPVLVLPQGKGALAVDALFIKEAADECHVER